jgi:hypothetical protein
MKTSSEKLNIEKRIKRLGWFFISGLIISGLSAIPIQTELKFLLLLKPNLPPLLMAWFEKVATAIELVNKQYQFLAYGNDWLAFAHIVIALFFVGVIQNPVRNIWITEACMIACALVFPFAFVFGSIRGIPFWWQLIDCSFGAIGLLPLLLIHKASRQLKQVRKADLQRNMHKTKEITGKMLYAE